MKKYSIILMASLLALFNPLAAFAHGHGGHCGGFHGGGFHGGSFHGGSHISYGGFHYAGGGCHSYSHYRHHLHFGNFFGWHHHFSYPSSYSSANSLGTTNGVMQPGGNVVQPVIPVDPNARQGDVPIIPGVLPAVPGPMYGNR